VTLSGIEPVAVVRRSEDVAEQIRNLIIRDDLAVGGREGNYLGIHLLEELPRDRTSSSWTSRPRRWTSPCRPASSTCSSACRAILG
jgi:hypothetical protein